MACLHHVLALSAVRAGCSRRARGPSRGRWVTSIRMTRSGAGSISRSMGDVNPDDPFRRSAAASRGVDWDDDEENLRWAALEKLPTYDRMRRGIIRKELDAGVVRAGKQYEPYDVDIANLDQRAGRELMERVFKAVEDDAERFLRRFKDRLDLVGIELIELPQIKVRYERTEIL